MKPCRGFFLSSVFPDIRAQVERLALEQLKANAEIAELHLGVDRLDGPHAVMIQGEKREPEERNMLHAEQLRVAWQRSQHEVEELLATMIRERAAANETEKQARLAHDREMAELTRQTARLGSPRRSFVLVVEPFPPRSGRYRIISGYLRLAQNGRERSLRRDQGTRGRKLNRL